MPQWQCIECNNQFRKNAKRENISFFYSFAEKKTFSDAWQTDWQLSCLNIFVDFSSFCRFHALTLAVFWFLVSGVLVSYSFSYLRYFVIVFCHFRIMVRHFVNLFGSLPFSSFSNWVLVFVVKIKTKVALDLHSFQKLSLNMLFTSL